MALALTKSQIDGVPVLRVRGDIDISNFALLKAALSEISTSSEKGFIVSLLDCKYADSTAMMALLQAQSALPKGRIVLVVRPNDRLMRAFDIANLSERMAFAASLESAAAVIDAS